MTRALPMILAAASIGWAARSFAEPAEVTPAELTKHAELVNREVIVDGRTPSSGAFEYHKDRGFDIVRLQKTPVLFRLPPKLAFQNPPVAPAIRFQGTLKKEGGQFVCDVASLEILPDDATRLAKAVASLRPNDATARSRWAHWAEFRAAEYADAELGEKARDLEGEAIRIEAERPAKDPSQNWLALAERAKKRRVPEPLPSALAHRALRATLKDAGTAADLDRLLPKIEALFPDAQRPNPDPPDLSDWSGPYANDPYGTYLRASKGVRAALDRELVADALTRAFDLRAAEAPQKALALADEAKAKLPDRPKVASRLLDKGLEANAENVGGLRKSEVLEMAKSYEDLGRADRGRDLKRQWLDNQRNHRLPKGDAYGRLSLAREYDAMLGDKEAAAELLNEALKLDPKYKEAEDAFRRMGYQKIGEEWVPPEVSRAPAPSVENRPSTPKVAKEGSLQGATRAEVIAKMGGKPDRIVRVASQGQIVEQWIYRAPKKTQYINFLAQNNSLQPRVIAHYALP
jgi:hypothetical protein